MSTKLYDKIRKFFKENWLFLFGFLFFFFLFQIKFPYYIKAPGGLAPASERLHIEGANPSSGSYNLAYVSEYEATIPTLLIALLNPNWDIVKKEEEILSNETMEDNERRSHLLLEEANQNAILYAYQKAGREFTILSSELYILYIAENIDTTLKVGDKIESINGIKVNTKKELEEVIHTLNIGDELSFTVIRNGSKTSARATIILVEGMPKIGIMLSEQKKIETIPKFSFSFDKNESGSSGGLMMTLAIYDALTEEDLTKGKTIVGTGTIDEYGVVGEIGGVRYKLIGAVKKGADVFLVPSANYEEAMQVKKEKNYSIPIIAVETFEDAVAYLEKNG